MKICVYGLWHLGSVTAACLAGRGFETVGLDPYANNVANLRDGVPPLFEEGLADLIKNGVAAGNLSFTDDIKAAIGNADVVWVTFDTPVDNEDRADINYVNDRVAEAFPFLCDNAVVLISSQMPVGSVRDLEKRFATVAAGRTIHFACSPENLRLGSAVKIFNSPGRIVVGTRSARARDVLEKLLTPICDQLIWMSVESAEMTKHALNAFLATCVVFINEVAAVCELVGADAVDVEKAIRSDPRVGTKTYVTPGAAFAGGTLARDVTFLNEIGAAQALALPMLGGILPSNAEHRRWAIRRLRHLVKPLAGSTVAVLGLSYKPGTDATRRSVAIELCDDLVGEGVQVRAYDPQVTVLPPPLAQHVTLCASATDAMTGSQAVVVATEWPEFREITADNVLAVGLRPLVLDQARFLAKTLGTDRRIEYFQVGTSK